MKKFGPISPSLMQPNQELSSIILVTPASALLDKVLDLEGFHPPTGLVGAQVVRCLRVYDGLRMLQIAAGHASDDCGCKHAEKPYLGGGGVGREDPVNSVINA